MATDSDVRNIFGLATTVAYIRALPYSTFVARKMCEGIAQGFGLSVDDGDAIFSYFNTQSHPEQETIFYDTVYSDYETAIQAVFYSYYPDLTQRHVELLAAAAHAMIFAYVVNASINITDFQTYIGKVLTNVATSIFESSPFDAPDGIPITPFSSYQVLKSFLDNNYSTIFRGLKTSIKTVEAPLTNYNWYDTSTILHGPNLQLMKDVESQYYYLSGKMMYEGAFGSVETCIEDEATISTWSGDATFTYVRNTPCKEPDSYIGPVAYTQFKRIFNDGPSSSGYFSGKIPDFYIGNDKSILDSKDYLTNNHDLKTYTGSALCSQVFIDANGPYDLLNGDYGNAPYSWGCSVPLQRMHIGDNRPRYICDSMSCVCTLSKVTGFKFAAVELPNEVWASGLQFQQTNPLSNVDRIRQRAWNVSDNPYVATDEGGILWPYFLDIHNVQHWYVGYPVLNGGNNVPELAFFQTFDSPTFGEGPSLCFFPSLAESFGTPGEGDSNRTYHLGSKYLFSGASDLPLKFDFTVSSNLSGYDNVTQKFFGMGTAFSGLYNIEVSEEENAGFFYSGFSVFLNGQTVNSVTLADSFKDSIIGKYKTIKYISGYKNNDDNTLVELENKFALDNSGNLYTYAYFNNTDAAQQDGWLYFAPVPTELEASPYSRIYDSQTVESYLPRFYDGPFSTEQRTFLYPNAEESDKTYQGKLNGIPTKIKFKVTIREESVKEVYAKYQIHSDGSIDTHPSIINPIRSDTMGTRTINPIMTNIFLPDNPNERHDYNFNFLPYTDTIDTDTSIGDLVDNNWAPLISYGGGFYVPSGRNSNVYDNTNIPSFALYHMGLRKTGDGHNTHLLLGPGGNIDYFFSSKPITDGLYHSYSAVELTGELDYVLPIFDLEKNAIFVNSGMLYAFPDMVNRQGLLYYSYNGYGAGFDTGLDPLFLEYIGGRRGGPTAEQEGGYHSKGLIGDRWDGLVYNDFGIQDTICGEDTTVHVKWRYPAFDDRLALFNGDASGTDIWINGMKFSPFVIKRNATPLDDKMLYPYQADANFGHLPVVASGEYINFDILPYFTLKSRTGDITNDQWYYTGGLLLGPFDRDIEIGITEGQVWASFSELYVNGARVSHWFWPGSSCDKNFASNIGVSESISCGQPFYAYPRNAGYSIISVVPSGTRANINIQSKLSYLDLSNVDPGEPALHYIGMASGAVLSLKTHVPLDSEDYDFQIHSGEEGWRSSSPWVDNGAQGKYRIKHAGPANIGGLYEFTNLGITGKLYPRPDETEFAKLSMKDTYGNITYDKSVTPENYWRSYAVKHGITVTISGYRESSRISFDISNIEVASDVLPYQSYKLVTPSGNCTISGEMGYYAQADNSIFTEGIHLVNATLNDDFAETYNPSYVSEVLKRVPFFTFPVTVSGNVPVLPAPSVMKQREFISGISENQTYHYFNKQPPYSYNKLLWPALSDLETLNPGETIESIPPGDGNTFDLSSVMFSACQGQPLPNGLANPILIKTYGVQDIFQLYDSVTTDAWINSGFCITSGRGTRVELSQLNLSGALVPRGSPLTFVIQGLV